MPGNYIVQVTDTNGVLGTGRTYTTPGGATNANADVTTIGATNLNIDFGLNNRPPVDGNETNVVTEDTPLVVGAASGLLANAVDPDGSPMTVSAFTVPGVGAGTVGTPLTIPGVGSLTIQSTGAYTFTPALNFTGPIPVVTYTVRDSGGLTDTSTLTLSMVPVNDPPVDGDETNTVTEDTTLTVPAATGLLANATDVDGDTPLTVSAFTVPGVGAGTVGTPLTIPGVGSLTIQSTGAYTFTPDLNFTGPIPVVTYTVRDPGGLTDTSTLTLTMVPVNDPPVDGNETNTVTEDTTLTVPAATGLLANATDVDGDTPLTVSAFTVPGVGAGTVGTPLTIPGVGSLTIQSTGAYTFTPDLNFTGPIPVVTYTVRDPGGLTDTSTLTLTMVPVNDPPVDGNETNTVTEDTTLTVPAATGLLANATDVDGDTPLTVSAFTVPGVGAGTVGTPLTIPGVGSLTIQSTGAYTFTPDLNFTGPIPVVTYTVRDPGGLTDTSTLTLTMVPVNDPPDAVDDNQAVLPGVDTPLTLLANDSDVDGDSPLTVIAATLADPTQGTLTQQPDGSWSFVSAPGVSGPVVVNYTISDPTGATDSAVHTVNVANQPPVVVDPDPTPGTPSIDPADPTNLLVPAVDNVPLSVDLDDYYTDPNTGDTLTITPDLTGLPAWVTYDPATGILGGTPPVDNSGTPVVVPVTVDDGQGGTFTGTITITPVNPGPDAVDDTQAVGPVTPTTVTFLANDTDPDGDPLTVTAATLVDPTQGTLTQEPDGSWTFTSTVGVSGPVLINYTITDQDGATDSAVHTVDVGNVPPTLVDPDPTPGTPSIDPADPTNLLVPAVDNVPVAVDLDDYFTDPNTGDTLTITPDLTGLPAWVTYDPATGILGGTPPVDNVGPVVVPVTVDDGQGGTFTGTITITPVNPGPDAVDDTQAVQPETATPLTLLSNDTDPDGDPLTVTDRHPGRPDPGHADPTA